MSRSERKVPFPPIMLPVPIKKIRSVSVGREGRRAVIQIMTAEDPPRRRRIYAGIDGVKHAARIVAELEKAVREGKGPEPKRPITLGEFTAEYKDFLARARSRRTRLAYEGALEELGRDIPGDRPLREIMSEDIQRLRIRRGREVSGRTVNNLIRALRAIFNHAISLEHIERNPAAGLGAVAEHPRPKRVLTEDEIPRFLAAVTEEARPPIHFALLTGLRLGAIVALDWSWLDLKRGVVEIQEDKWTRLEKRRVKRIPLSQAAVSLLKALPGPHKGRVFRRMDGRPWTHHLTRQVKQAAKNAGIEGRVTFHTLRHTFGTLLTRRVSPRAAQAALGHEDIRDTLRYYDIADEEYVRQGVEAVGRDLSPAKTADILNLPAGKNRAG